MPFQRTSLVSGLRPALVMLAAFVLILGVIYPLLVTAVAEVLFSHRARGSMIRKDGIVIGSKLLGQNFTEAKYFHGRPSATEPPYNPAASAAAHYGPLSAELKEEISARIDELTAADPARRREIPAELLLGSGSGLDPHITVAAAEYQVKRVAQARGMTEEEVRELVQQSLEPLQFGMLGVPRVNVLLLNLALDEKTLE